MNSKRLLSLVLALAMILGTFSFVSAASDIEGTVYEDAVDRLSLLNVLQGYPDGTFKPDNQITRAEFAAVAVRIKGLEDAANATKGLATGFIDVPASHWASGYVGTAAKLGIVNGIGNNLFAPEAPVKYEEAITMIVRALGYEPAAKAKGGYPYGYIIVANEVGLLDDVKGVQGLPAVRGVVAQIADNALEIPLMIQVGFGTDAKYVVSGSKEHGDNAEEKYLLDEMGFDYIKGRVESVSSKNNKITVKPKEGKAQTLKVEKGFDFYEVEGRTVKFWHKNDSVIVYALKDEVKFDAVKYDEKVKVKLLTADEKYDVAKDAYLELNGDKVDVKDFTADYAKMVFNDDNEIVWAQGYKLNGFILVKEVKDNIVYNYDNYDELKVKGFKVVADGKTIGIDGLEEGDILFYNTSKEFAVAYNNAVEGELERVYTDLGFRLEGKAYERSGLGYIYYDDGKVGDVTEKILTDLLDEKVAVTAFLDFAGKAVIIEGEVSTVGSSAYGVLLDAPVSFNGRKGAMIALDLRNGANEKVSYDIAEKDITKDVKLAGELKGKGVAEVKALAKGTVLKLSLKKDGSITEIYLPDSIKNADAFKITAANVKAGGYNYRLEPSTIIFHDSNKKATTIGDAKDVFAEVKALSTIYLDKGRVVAVVGDTDADKDTKTVVGLVTGVSQHTNGKLQFTVKVFGETQRLDTEAKDKKLGDFIGYKDEIKAFKVGETSGEIKDFDSVTSQVIKVKSISGRTIYGTNNEEVELNRNAIVYNNAKSKEINLTDIKANEDVTVYLQGASKRFVDYVVAGVAGTPSAATGLVTYINTTGFMSMAIDGTTYYANAQTIVKDKNGAIVGMGSFAPIATGDQVEVKDNVATIKFTAAELAAAELTRVQAKAAARLAQTTPAGSMTVGNDTQLAAAKAAVAAVTAPALTTAEIALLSDGPTPPATTPTKAAYNTAETNLTATKTNIANYEAVVEFKRLVGLFTATPTLADKANIVAARTEYGKLTTIQAGLVTTEYGVLTAAEVRITALETATTEVNNALAAISLVVTNGDQATVTLTATQGGTHANVGAPVMTIVTTPVPTGVSLTSPKVDITRQAEAVVVIVKVELTSTTEATIKASKTFEITVPATLAAPVVK